MVRRGHIHVWAVLAVSIATATYSEAQSVVDIYQRQYYRQQAMQWIRLSGERIQPRPYQSLPAPLDSISAANKETTTPTDVVQEPPPLSIRNIQRIPKLARGYFERRFKGQPWVFAGANRVVPLDTMMTREIRARLQARFGKPTRTIVDDDPRQSVSEGDIFQFEYWFVLDNEIPLVITDTNGPFERGVAVSTTEPFGAIVVSLRDALLRPIVESDQRAPFVDYYYDDEIAQWYRTGYDGVTFFLDPVNRPGLNRPILQPETNRGMQGMPQNRNVPGSLP